MRTDKGVRNVGFNIIYLIFLDKQDKSNFYFCKLLNVGYKLICISCFSIGNTKYFNALALLFTFIKTEKDKAEVNELHNNEAKFRKDIEDSEALIRIFIETVSRINL